jgi:hypothetical protein
VVLVVLAPQEIEIRKLIEEKQHYPNLKQNQVNFHFKKIVADYLVKNPSIKSGIDFHSYSQFILRPWAKTNTLIPEENLFRSYGENIKNAIKKVDNQDYRNMRGIEVIFLNY